MTIRLYNQNWYEISEVKVHDWSFLCSSCKWIIIHFMKSVRRYIHEYCLFNGWKYPHSQLSSDGKSKIPNRSQSPAPSHLVVLTPQRPLLAPWHLLLVSSSYICVYIYRIILVFLMVITDFVFIKENVIQSYWIWCLIEIIMLKNRKTYYEIISD